MIRLILIAALPMLSACTTSELTKETADETSGITLQGGKADAWDKLNDPQRFLRFLDKELEYTLADLPMDGTATKEP